MKIGEDGRTTVLHGKPDVENPEVRLEDVASGQTRSGRLAMFSKRCILAIAAVVSTSVFADFEWPAAS